MHVSYMVCASLKNMHVHFLATCMQHTCFLIKVYARHADQTVSERQASVKETCDSVAWCITYSLLEGNRQGLYTVQP